MFISLYQIGRIDLSIIKLLLRDGISMIYWGLGDDYDGHLRIGIPWFLISLFWSKLIIDVLSVYFKKQDVFYLIIFIAILGLYLSVNKIILIQGMTTNFISVFLFILECCGNSLNLKLVNIHSSYLSYACLYGYTQL